MPNDQLTPRERLVALAADAAAATQGVAGLATPPHSVHVSLIGGRRLVGVSAAAVGDGFDVTLCIAAHPVPLEELADRLRGSIRRAAEMAGLAGALGRIDVQVTDVVTGAAT